MPRTFSNAASDKLDVALGAGGSMTGAVTLASICKAASDQTGSTLRVVLEIGSSNASIRYALYRTSGELLRFRCGATDKDLASPSWTVAAVPGWVLVAATKAAGTSVVRLHFYVYDTNTWTHTDIATGVASITPATGSSIGYSRAGNKDSWDGQIAVAGAWAAALTDAEVEALAYDYLAWWAVAPNGLWVLDQAATGTKVNDHTGNGANESALTGTSVSTLAAPVWGYSGPTIRAQKVGVTATPKSDSDTGTGTDANGSIALTGVGDTAAGAEAGTIAATLTNAETATGADVNGSIAFSTTETGAAVDAAARIALAGDDPGTAADNGAINATLTGADTGSQSDTNGTIALSSSDSATSSENQTVAVAFTSADTGTAVDANGAIALSAPTDTGAAAEAGTIAATTSSSDAAIAADTNGSIALSTQSDTGTGVDDYQSLGSPVSSTDTGTAADAEGVPAIRATQTNAETATAAENGTLSAAPSNADTGTAVDANGSIRLSTQADTAAAVDAGAPSPTLLSADTGTATENQSFAVLVTSSDSATAVDNGTLAAAFTQADTATAAEAQVTIRLSTQTDTGSSVDGGENVVESTANPVSSSDSGTATDAALRIALSDVDVATALDAEIAIAATLISADFGHAVEDHDIRKPPIVFVDFPAGPDTITETIPRRPRNATLTDAMVMVIGIEEETLTDVVDTTRRYW